MKKISNYQWLNPELHRKSKKYNYIVYGIAIVSMLVFFLAPGNAKMISMLMLLVAGYFMVKSWGFQSKDKALKQNEWVRKQQQNSSSK
jgi:hypothetical protein